MMAAAASPEAVDVFERAARRAANDVRLEMAAGAASMAGIATLAPLLGCFATLIDIGNCFGPIVGEKSAIMQALFRGLSMVLWPFAVGLAVAVIAHVCHRYWMFRLDTVDFEMRSAISYVAGALRDRRDPWIYNPASPVDSPTAAGSRRWSNGLAAVSLLLASYALEVSHRWLEEWVPLRAALQSGAWHVSLVFLLLLYPSQLLTSRKRHGSRTTFALAALGCLLWSVVRYGTN